MEYKNGLIQTVAAIVKVNSWSAYASCMALQKEGPHHIINVQCERFNRAIFDLLCSLPEEKKWKMAISSLLRKKKTTCRSASGTGGGRTDSHHDRRLGVPASTIATSVSSFNLRTHVWPLTLNKIRLCVFLFPNWTVEPTFSVEQLI